MQQTGLTGAGRHRTGDDPCRPIRPDVGTTVSLVDPELATP
jgi:hypothetical protein